MYIPRVITEAWGQTVEITYGSFWGFSAANLNKPHTVVIGESIDDDRVFVGSISQFTIEDR